jgi:hypothetical protein
MHQAVYCTVKMIAKKRGIDSKFGNDRSPANERVSHAFQGAATCPVARAVA